MWAGTGVSATGREPVGLAGIGAMMDRRRGHHEVSILIAAGTGVGRCFGSEPRAKVSMMNMRPPQQGHGLGSTRGWSIAAAVEISGGWEGGGAASRLRARAMLAARRPLASSP